MDKYILNISDIQKLLYTLYESKLEVPKSDNLYTMIYEELRLYIIANDKDKSVKSSETILSQRWKKKYYHTMIMILL